MPSLSLVQVKGIPECIRALRKTGTSTEAGIARGLMRAGLLLQRESMKIVPVDTGNLRASAFTQAEDGPKGAQVRVGYTAFYALYVHERLDLAHRPPTQAKFLEQPYRDLQQQMIDIITAAATRGVYKT